MLLHRLMVMNIAIFNVEERNQRQLRYEKHNREIINFSSVQVASDDYSHIQREPKPQEVRKTHNECIVSHIMML